MPLNPLDPAASQDNPGVLAETGDFLMHGLSSAAVSAGVSVLNTGIELGNMLPGVNNSEISTENTLRQAGMEDTADYYNKHQAFMDGLGFIAGSFVPGTLGIKGLKAAQAAIGAGELATGTRLATGLRAALIPNKSVEAVETAVRYGNINSAATTFDALKLKNIASSVHQAALEAAAFEGTVLLTMNQNNALKQTSLTGEDLGYMDAIVHNLDSAAIGFVGGTLIGGIFASVATRGRLAGLLRESDLETKVNRRVGEAPSIGLNAGDEMYPTMQSYFDLKGRIASDSFKDLEKGTQTEITSTFNRTTESLKARLQVLTRGDEGLNTIHIDKFLSGDYDSLDTALRTFSGTRRLERWGAQDYLNDVPAGAIDWMTGDQIDIFVRDMWHRNMFNGQLVPTETDLQQALKANGFTFNGPLTHINNVKGAVNVERWADKIEGGQLDAENIFTLRHEVGHSSSYFFTSDIVKNSKLGRTMLQQAEDTSRLARPDDWRAVDRYERRLADGKPITQEHQDWIDYMRSSDELLADSVAMFGDPEHYLQLRQQAPELHNLLWRNDSIKRFTRNGTQVMRNSDGMLLETVQAPTAADIGDFTLNDGIISFGGNHVAIDKVFNEGIVKEIMDGTTLPIDLNAIFSTSKTRPDIFDGMEINFYDLPRLTAAVAQGKNVIVKHGLDDAIVKFGSLENVLLKSKIEIGSQLLDATRKAHALQGFANNAEDILSNAQIGQVIDTGENFVAKLGAHRYAESIGKPSEFISEKFDIPQWSNQAGVDSTLPYYTKVIPSRDSIVNQIKGYGTAQRAAGEAEILARIKQRQDNIGQVFASYMKDDFHNFEPNVGATGVNQADNVTAIDKSSGVFSSANDNYLSAMSWHQNVGAAVARVETKKLGAFAAAVEPNTLRAMSHQESVNEFAAFSSRLRSQPGNNPLIFQEPLPEFLANRVYTQGDQAVIDKSLQQFHESGLADQLFNNTDKHVVWTQDLENRVVKLLTTDHEDEFEFLDNAEGLSDLIKTSRMTVKNDPLASWMRGLVDHNSTEIVPHKNLLNVALGGSGTLNPRAIYIGPVNTQRFPFFALVVPKAEGVFAHSDKGVVVAKDAADLQAKIEAVNSKFGTKVDVFTAGEIKRHKELLNEYESSRLFRDSLMDADLRKAGIYSDVAPQADPGLFNDVLNTYQQQIARLTRGMTEAHYAEETAMLKSYSQQWDDLNSTVAGAKKGRNAFKDAHNLMLAKRPDDPSSVWNEINRVSDQVMAKAFGGLKGILNASKETGEWSEVNKYIRDLGLEPVYADAAKQVLTNVEATTPQMGRLVSKFNGVIGTMMLRADPTQGLVNMVSLPVNLIAEMQKLQKVASKERWQVLRNGTSIKIDGTNEVMHLGPLLYQAVKNIFGANSEQLTALYKSKGLVNSMMTEFKVASEQVALAMGQKDPGVMETAFDNFLNFISKPSDWSEQVVKMVAANVADQLTSVLKIPENIKWSTVNTFVNRVHGNYIASQRPTAFQGWLGQSLGLFQTYQFNLMQNFFKYVADGNNSIAKNMILTQGGIFGVQSIPGFKAINNYVGQLSDKHNDFYKGTNNVLGDHVANTLLYGLASSSVVPILGNGIDLYTRGDLTPRTPILLPTSPADVPMVSVATNFAGAMINMYKKVSNGGPFVGSAVDALAHNGLNRPLAGAFQLIEGARTTNSGTALFTYQGWDALNTMTKLVGTKTLDEAIAADSYYRTLAYKQQDNKETDDLGQAVRQSMRSGKFDQEAYMDFMRSYTALGKNKQGFDGWVKRNIRTATESQISAMRNKNNSVEGQYLQEVMGGTGEE